MEQQIPADRLIVADLRWFKSTRLKPGLGHLIGPGPTLFLAKLLACGCGAVLYTAGITRTLAALTALYLLAAIGPWLLILSS